MKVEDLIIDFYERRIDLKVSHIAADLYIYLISESGKRKMEASFVLSTERICLWLKIDRKTLSRAREELQTLGFISYSAQKGSGSPQYTIEKIRAKKSNLCDNLCRQNGTQNATQSASQNATQSETQSSKDLNINNLQETGEIKNDEKQTKESIKEKTKDVLPPTPPIIENKKENIKEKIYITHAREKPIKTREAIIADTEKRKADFYNSLIPFLQTYGKEILREFFDYWSEPNKSQSKMRFEMEKTWDLSRRLARWANNNKKNYRNGISKQDEERRQRAMEAAELIQELDAESDAEPDPYLTGGWDWRSQLHAKVSS